MKKITKWCIRRTEEYHEPINKWFAEQTNRAYSAKSDYHRSYMRTPSYWTYLHYPMVNGLTLLKNIYNGYTEITHEEFEKFVLNSTTVTHRLLKHWKNPNHTDKIEIKRK